MPRKPPQPLTTDELIDRAYQATREEHLHKVGPWPLDEGPVPPQLSIVLRMVDYIVRQRILDHTEREPHRSQQKRRGA